MEGLPTTPVSPPAAETPQEHSNNELPARRKTIHHSRASVAAKSLLEPNNPTRIVVLRGVILVMLALLAALLGYFVYVILVDAEVRQFLTTFNAAGLQLDSSFQVN